MIRARPRTILGESDSFVTAQYHRAVSPRRDRRSARSRYRAAVLDHATQSLLARANAARRQGRRDQMAEDALARTFDCERRLAVYGTLAPGCSNHHELAACPGRWSRGEVHGHLSHREFPLLVPADDAPLVAVQVLRSAALPAHWEHLDAFEGDDYCRVLAPVRCGDTTTVANLYARRD